MLRTTCFARTVTTITVTTTPPLYSKFVDVLTTDWFCSYVNAMAEAGIVNGYPGNVFKPNNNVTRAELAKIMAVAAGLDTPKPTQQIFDDVGIDQWYAPYVHATKDYFPEMTDEDGNVCFDPNEYAGREDVAMAVAKIKGLSAGAEGDVQTRFSDDADISPEAKTYIAAAVDAGIVYGYEDGTFKPRGAITRAELATVCCRAFS